MSNDLIRAAQSGLVKSEGSLANSAGNTMLYAGGGGLGLMAVAGLLPFISLPMLLVALVVGGVTLKVKGSS